MIAPVPGLKGGDKADFVRRQGGRETTVFNSVCPSPLEESGRSGYQAFANFTATNRC